MMTFCPIKDFGDESPGGKSLVRRDDGRTDHWLPTAGCSPWWRPSGNQENDVHTQPYSTIKLIRLDT